jgi:hypothetical protein
MYYYLPCPGNTLQPSHVPSAVEVKPSGRTELPEVIVTSYLLHNLCILCTLGGVYFLSNN